MIAAILRAQWLSMRVGSRGLGRGTVFSIITALIWYGIWSVVAVGAFAMSSEAGANQLAMFLPLGFLAVFLYWQLAPVLSASMGTGLDMRKLLAYPIPHGKLYQVELLLRVITAAEMVLVLAGGFAGLAANSTAGGWQAVPRLLAAFLVFLLFNVLLSSGTRSLLERLLARRRIREILIILMLSAVMLPRLMLLPGFRPAWLPDAGVALALPAWPWSAASSMAATGAGQQILLALALLCSWTALAGWFGRGQFERSLRYDAAALQATPAGPVPERGRGWTERFYSLPGMLWRDPLAAIVEKELRSLARTPRFRTVFVMGFTFGLLVWLPTMFTRHGGRSSGTSGYFLLIVCVYALTLLGQVTYWNCFGFDRSAVQLYFAAPISLSTTLVGKNIASLVYIFVEVLILTGITMALRLATGWGRVVETLVVVGVCSVYMLALGNLSSVQYPRALNPDRVSQGGASSRFQALVFLLYPLALLPVGLSYLARYAFDSEAAFLIMLALAAVMGGVLYWQAMQSAVKMGMGRREALLQELSKGEGPIASG